MTTCPNCGTESPDNYAFCGNCGTDLRPARTIQSELKATPSIETRAAPAPTSSPLPNPFDSSAYDYSTSRGPRRARPIVIWVVVVAIAVVCFVCGFISGGLSVYWLEPLPTPVPVPQPQGLLQLVLLFL